MQSLNKKIMASMELNQYTNNNEDIKHFDRIECDIINGKKEGPYKKYECGILTVACNYVNDMLEGEYKQYYPDGQLSMVHNYVNNKINGVSIHYFRSGQVATRSHRINNSLEGETIIYYDNGLPKTICNYKNGDLDGEFKYYDYNGQLKATYTYIRDAIYKSQKVGEEKHYDNGQLSLICTHVLDKDNNSNLEGAFIEYHYNGKVKTSSTYVNNKLHGEYKKYDEEGILVEHCEYINGVKQNIN